MINILRDIKKLIINGTVAIKFITWKIEDTDVERKASVLFSDGVISINSKSKSFIHQVQADRYAFFVDDAEEIISKYSLVDGDLFIGRIDNYLLFRDNNLNIKCNKFILDCDEVNIEANDITINTTNLTKNATTININADVINEVATTSINITGNFILNGIPFSVAAGKLSISGKELAVVGGDVNLSTGEIITSGQ